MSDGLELTISVAGQGGPPPVLEQTRKSLQGVGEDLDLSNRRARALAAEGLAQVSQFSPQLASQLYDMARNSETALAVLQNVGVAAAVAGAAVSGIAIGTYIRQILEFGHSLEQELALQNKLMELQTNWLNAQKTHLLFINEQDKARIDNEAAIAAVQLRAGSRNVDAIEAERKGHLDVLAIQEHELALKLQEINQASKQDDATFQQGQRLEAALANIGSQRRRIEAEADDKVRQARDADFKSEQQQEAALVEAVEARKQATLDAQQAILQGEAVLFGIAGKQLEEINASRGAIFAQWRTETESNVAAAIQASSQRVAAITAEKDKAIKAREDEVAAGTLTVDRFTRLRADLESTANTKIGADRQRLSTQLLQIQETERQREQALRETRVQQEISTYAKLRDAAAAARQATLDTVIQVMTNDGRLAEAARLATDQRLSQIRAEAEGELREWAQGVAQKKITEAEFAEFRIQQNARTQAKILAALEQERQARRALIAEAAGIQKDIGGGTTFQGLKGVDDLQMQAAKLAQAWADLRSQGVPLETVYQDIGRDSDALKAKYQALLEQYKNNPVVANLLRQQLGDIGRGDFDLRVRDTGSRLEALKPGATGSDDALAKLGNRLLQQVVPAFDAGSRSVYNMNVQLESLSQWLEYIATKFDQVGRAI